MLVFVWLLFVMDVLLLNIPFVQEEMDMKVIQFKNKKLCERLEQRQAMEDELREKIEKLEKRQATDDTTLLIVNRYWSQVVLHVS